MDETWTGWCGLEPYDAEKLFIAIRASHLPVFKGGDVVIANSVDFAKLADIMHGCNIRRTSDFKAVAFTDAEVAKWEAELSKDDQATYSKHAEDIKASHEV